jgi:hypothetical protein
MRSATAHTQTAARWRQAACRLALVACATTSVAALSATPALAGEGEAPKIESLGTAVGGEVTVSAHINPEGLETSYEIKLECGPEEPVPCDSIPSERQDGRLPADYELHEVTLTLTGLQPGTYWFGTRAINTAGEALWVSNGLKIPSLCPNGCEPLPFPEGTAPTGPVEAPYLGAANEQLNKIAIQEAERRAKEKEAEERKTRELNARPASELEHTEEPPPAVHTPAEHPACRVPALKGDTLTAARRALAKAHCRLGTVHRPAHLHGTLRVSAQGALAGEQLVGGARVMLTLGAKRASRRGKGRR